MNLVKTYFFVPANNVRFIIKSESLSGIDHKVFDLEDAIVAGTLQESIQNLVDRSAHSSDFVRLVVDDVFEKTVNTLSGAGYRNFVLPKLRDESELESTLNILDRIAPGSGVVVLIENPLLYVQLLSALQKHSSKLSGIGLGSHDFAASTRMRHDLEALQPIRLNVALMAHAFGIEAIDVASMQIRDIHAFEAELKSGFEMGYRAKFILHPSQLEAVNGYGFYTLEEFQQSGIVLSKMESQALEQKAVTMVDGVIYEKPHLERLKEIHQWGKTHYGTDR
jgi:citrate lyase beta subunit